MSEVEKETDVCFFFGRLVFDYQTRRVGGDRNQIEIFPPPQ